MNTEQERADFEAWADKRGLNLHKVTPCDGSEPYYADSAGPTAWAAWNTRSALQSQDREDATEWLKQHEALMHRVSKAAIVVGYGGTINGATAEATLENAERLLMDHARRIEGEGE